MASLNQNKQILDLLKEEKRDFARPLLSVRVEDKHDSMVFPMNKDLKEQHFGLPDDARENKVVSRLPESSGSTLQKLQSFFEIVQKQQPESRLELQCVNGNWRVWCGACKKLLRPDKSGKAIHNIQRQHFASSRHKKKLHLLLHGEEPPVAERPKKAERQKKAPIKGGGKEVQNRGEPAVQPS